MQNIEGRAKFIPGKCLNLATIEQDQRRDRKILLLEPPLTAYSFEPNLSFCFSRSTRYCLFQKDILYTVIPDGHIKSTQKPTYLRTQILQAKKYNSQPICPLNFFWIQQSKKQIVAANRTAHSAAQQLQLVWRSVDTFNRKVKPPRIAKYSLKVAPDG